jgi:glycosyltransferase involved in cell wall biosynthesis
MGPRCVRRFERRCVAGGSLVPRLTIIMPAKDAASTIKLSLGSTLRALPRDSEIIVWDDGSQDQTSEVAESMRDPRIRIIRNEISVGGGMARRSVMASSDSEFVASMDADDYCFPWRFKVQLPAMKRADLSFAAAVRFWNSGSKLRLKPTNPLPLAPPESRLALLFHNPFFHPSMLGRRAVIEASGGYTDQKVAQDYDLWLRVAARGGRIVKTGIPTVGYRQSTAQISSSAGYGDRVRSDLRLRGSYSSLVRSILGEDQGKNSEVATTIPEAELRRLVELKVGDLRLGTKIYYKRMLSGPSPFTLASTS